MTLIQPAAVWHNYFLRNHMQQWTRIKNLRQIFDFKSIKLMFLMF